MVDGFWLFERVLGPAAAVLAAAVLTGTCLLCARVEDHLLACVGAASVGFLVGVGLAWFARRNTRPPIRPDEGVG